MLDLFSWVVSVIVCGEADSGMDFGSFMLGGSSHGNILTIIVANQEGKSI